MIALSAPSASVLLMFASDAIASTSSPLFTLRPPRTACVRCYENVFTEIRQAFLTQRAWHPPLVARLLSRSLDARRRARGLLDDRASRRASTPLTMLDDGTYDAFIIWAEQRDDGVALECTITSGELRGEVVNIVTSSFVARDPLSLVGLACTLIVRDNEIRVAQ